MAKRRRNVLIYSDGTLQVHTPMTIEVDSGEGWLTPDQLDYLSALRTAYAFTRNFTNALPPSRQRGLMIVYKPEPFGPGLLHGGSELQDTLTFTSRRVGALP